MTAHHRSQYVHPVTPWAKAALSSEAVAFLEDARREGIEVHVNAMTPNGPFAAWCVDYRGPEVRTSPVHQSRSAEMAARLAYREAVPLERIGVLSGSDTGQAWGFGHDD